MFNPNARALPSIYYEGETNHCPGCSRTQWHIGRMTAECAFCATALPLQSTLTRGMNAPLIIKRGYGSLAIAA
jgi:hypothetical protein